MEVANRTGVGFIPKDITFSEWAVKWMETYKKPDVSENTYQISYSIPIHKHIIPYFHKVYLTDIKPINIKSFYTKKQHLSKSMLSKIQICLNGIFESAIDNELCAKNPCRGISYKSLATKYEKKVYTDNEILIVEKLAKDVMPEVIILLETGLRRGELLGLTWDDVDLKAKTITVNRSIRYQKGCPHGVECPPKKESYRTNPLSQQAVQTFKSLKKSSKYIFAKEDGMPYLPHNWSNKLKEFMHTLPPEIPHLTAHELRHTYGTYLRRHGVDIYTIQKIMGHKDIQMTTEIYVHNEIDTLKTALKVIDGGKSLNERLS